MRQTLLYDEYRSLGARVVDFHGWALPVQFAGIVHEHLHTRAGASVFDCSHMGEILIRGRDALERYDRLVISDVLALKVGRGRYGAILNEHGGIVDDVITIKLAEDEVLVVCNAATLPVVAGLIAADNPGVENVSDATAKIDVQGPASRDVLNALGVAAAAGLRYFQACRTQWQGEEIVLTRMGYTGELGFELYVPNQLAVPLWRSLVSVEGVEPAGLGARDTLRLEMGYPLSGQDFDESHTPLEARQEAFVAWDTVFTGKEALLAQRAVGRYPVLTAIRTSDRRAPRHGYSVFDSDPQDDDTPVGAVTSGTFGPSVGHGIGLAYLPRDHVCPGTKLRVGPRQLAVETVELPFYQHGTCRA